MHLGLIITGLVIVFALASYAASLLLKLRKQNQQQAQAREKQLADAKQKKESILTDIRYIATAMLEDRCELSEGVVRIARLFEVLSLVELVQPKYPNLFKHFEVIKDHPIMEQRKALDKKQRMQLDLARMKSEAALEADITFELKDIAKLDISSITN
ncbi:MAG: DUF2489 domain-containing protein [Parashewanella sp.]